MLFRRGPVLVVAITFFLAASIVSAQQFRPSGGRGRRPTRFFTRPAPRPSSQSFRPAPLSTGTRGNSNSNSNSLFVGGGRGNHVYNGKNYLLTWRAGQSSFTYDEARSFCASRGMRMVSLGNRAKAQHFNDELRRDNAPYFWAGGRISGDRRTLRWENGRTQSITRGRGFWSPAGNSGPQPENGGECLAILNNVYNDGIRWHDVTCHHRKPTICEEVRN